MNTCIVPWNAYMDFEAHKKNGAMFYSRVSPDPHGGAFTLDLIAVYPLARDEKGRFVADPLRDYDRGRRYVPPPSEKPK